MNLNRRVVPIALSLLLVGLFRSALADGAADLAATKAFLKQHCVRCHGAKKHEADVRLDDLSDDMTKDGERWAAVRDQLRDGLMPPEKEPRPDATQARAVVAWIVERSGRSAARLPNQGNLIPHEVLFGKQVTAGEAPAPRLWRLSPDGYLGFVRDVHRGRADGIVQPFTLIPERGIKDFAGLYSIDEPSTEILVRNAELIVEAQAGHELVDGKVRGQHDTVREFVQLMDPMLEPTRKELEAAVQTQFRLAIGRSGAADDVERLIGLYDKSAQLGDRPAAVKTMLAAVLLRADAMFRHELGNKDHVLPPTELAIAISLALTDRKERRLLAAAEKRELVSREQVEAHVRRILDDPKIEKPRLLGFFQTYFGYTAATDVFKDKPKDLMHEPRQYVADTDFLVQHILAEDRDVLRRLLTTPLSFVNLRLAENKQTRQKDVQTRAVVPNPHNNKGQSDVEAMYGLQAWPSSQPVELPPDTRLGLLMQPSWLVAWSTNFDNDVVRRGRFIRERLLGGTVPDLPIGVVAQVPDDPHRTYRDRLTVTREAKCWKCHQRMDDLGLAFENFDHFGRFRATESVVDLEATEKNVDKKGKPLGKVMREAELDTTGLVADSGDPQLDGPVPDPRELVTKLANSDRVRQVFIRHAFRYYLGRNETLSDAKTLQDADAAYVASGGSFQTLIVSLLSSDSFLMRKGEQP